MNRFAFIVLILCFTTGMAACTKQITPERAQANNLCLEAYHVYWGSDWAQVQILTTRAIESDPKFAWPYSLRGVAYTHQGHPELAVEDFSTALYLTPMYQPAYTNRAIAYIDIGEYDKAEADLIKAMDLDRFDVIAPVALAEVQSLRGKGHSACRSLEKAIRNGFRDLSVIENNRNFDKMVMDHCYQEIVDALFPDEQTALNSE